MYQGWGSTRPRYCFSHTLTLLDPSTLTTRPYLKSLRSEAVLCASAATAKITTTSISFQLCAVSSSVAHDIPEAGTLHVNMDKVRTRFVQFMSAADASASATRRDATALLFEQLLLFRASSGSHRMQMAQPSDIVEFLCWFDSCEPRRRTPVHALHCTAVGTLTLDSSSTMVGDCGLRYAHESLRPNYAHKL